jgi:DNA-binding IclR family transcriptional regulator
LGATGPLTLDEVAKRTNVPKASLLRLLKTLEIENLVTRRDGTYAAAATIVPIPGIGPRFEQRLESALVRVATSTGLAAEWYVPSPTGLILVKRAEPPDAEVRVQASVGFLRAWDAELEAVATIGLAFLKKGKASFGRHWTYVRDGVKTALSAADAKRRVERARADGYVIDTILNANGVRRMACPVEATGGRGVIAAAGHFAPSKKGHDKADIRVLLEEAAKLSPKKESGDF